MESDKSVQQDRSKKPLPEALDDLSDLLFHTDGRVARAAVKSLFVDIVEPLADSYRAADRRDMERILARLVTRARDFGKVGAAFSARLHGFGLGDEAALLRRMDRIRCPAPMAVDPARIRAVLLLSRVTIGADILLAGLAAEKALRAFPAAEIVFLGPGKNGTLFAGSPRFRTREVAYPRRGGLGERFFSWLEVADAVEEERRATGGEVLVINLDSRMLQSGLLPVLPEVEEKDRFFFWDPTTEAPEVPCRSLGEDLVAWLDTVFGTHTEPLHPRLHLPEADRSFAERVAAHFCFEKRPFTVSMNFGVGGNLRKRVVDAGGTRDPAVPSAFERSLVLGFLDAGAALILDQGFREEETRPARALMEATRAAGHTVVEVSGTGDLDGGVVPAPDRPVLVAFEGSVARLAALIRCTDLYVGYDSQGHHAAAALGRDVIAVFAGYDTPDFPDRWRPMGPGEIHVVHAGPGPFEVGEQADLANQVLALARRIRDRSVG